jgi:hypothetical protein
MRCVISGSFRKYYENIYQTIDVFEKLGIKVLSPKKSKIINPGENFAILETDSSKDIKTLELNHLEAIRKADFLYVCNPSGYMGTSTLVEIGFAIGCKKNLYFLEQPQDPVIASFANYIGSPNNIPR